MNDQEHFANMQRLEVELFAALDRGEKTVNVELSTHGWLCILDEIRNRRPRNFSQLLADDTLARLNDAIDRVHQEVLFLITANTSRSVAEGVNAVARRGRAG